MVAQPAVLPGPHRLKRNCLGLHVKHIYSHTAPLVLHLLLADSASFVPTAYPSAILSFIESQNQPPRLEKTPRVTQSNHAPITNSSHQPTALSTTSERPSNTSRVSDSTSPLLSTNTISNRCTLVHGTGAEGFFPPAKAWGPHVPPPHRGPSSPKPPRCGVRGGIPISKGAKLGLEGARQPRVQETLLQEAELLCWKERSEISKQRGEKATRRESPLQNRTLSNHCLLFPFDFSFFWLLEIPSPGTKQRKKKGSEQSSVRHSQL